MKKLLLLILASMMFITYSCKEESTDPSVDKSSNDKDKIITEESFIQFTKNAESAPLFQFECQMTKTIVYSVASNDKQIKSFTITGVEGKLQVFASDAKEVGVVDPTTVTQLVVQAKNDRNYDRYSNKLKFKLRVTKEATTDAKESIDYTILTTFEDDTTEIASLQFEIRDKPEVVFSGATSDQASDATGKESTIALDTGASLIKSDVIEAGGTSCQTVISLDNQYFSVTGASSKTGTVANYTLDKIIIKSKTVTSVQVAVETDSATGIMITDIKDTLTASTSGGTGAKVITDYLVTNGSFKFKLIDAGTHASKVNPTIHLTYIDPNTQESVKLIVKGAMTRVKTDGN